MRILERRKLTGVLVAALVLVFNLGEYGLGASAGGGSNTTAKNSNVISLTLSAAAVDMGDLSFSLSSEKLSALNTTVTSNNVWALSVQGAGDFSDGGSPAITIPIGRLTWRPNGSPTYTAFSTTAAAMLTGQAKTSAVGVTHNWDFRMAILDTDSKSANPFTSTLTFTATN